MRWIAVIVCLCASTGSALHVRGEAPRGARAAPTDVAKLYLPLVQRRHADRWLPVGQVGGRLSMVATDGRYAWVGVGPRLVAYDVADPARPLRLGASEPFTGTLAHGVVMGGYLYAAHWVDPNHFWSADGQGGLRVFNIVEPSAPRLVGRWDSPGAAEHVAVEGGRAYLADKGGGLRVLDVSRPHAPRELGAIETRGLAMTVVVRGGLAHVAASHYVYDRVYGESGLEVIDVRDPAAPERIGRLPVSDTVRALAVDGTVAYVGVGEEGFRVVDVADPARPAPLGAFGAGTVMDIHVEPSGRLHVLAVDDPDGSAPRARLATYVGGAAPRLEDEVVLESFAWRLAVGAGHAWVADPFRLHAVGLSGSAPAAGRVVEHVLAEPILPVVVEVDGGRAYVIDESEDWRATDVRYRMRVLDVSRPAHPRAVADWPLQGVDRFRPPLRVDGGRLAVTDFDTGLHIYDVADPARPVSRTHVAPRAWMWDVALQGDRAILAEETIVESAGVRRQPTAGGLRVIELDAPGGPREVGYRPGSAYAVAVAGGLVHVVADCGGPLEICLEVLEVEASGRVRPVAMVPLRAAIHAYDYAIDVAGAFAVVTADDVHLFDLSDPGRPVLAARMDVYASGTVGARASMIYALGFDALWAFDVAGPSDPRPLGHYRWSHDDEVTGLAVAGEHLYVAGRQGLWVFDAEPPCTSC